MRMEGARRTITGETIGNVFARRKKDKNRRKKKDRKAKENRWLLLSWPPTHRFVELLGSICNCFPIGEVGNVSFQIDYSRGCLKKVKERMQHVTRMFSVILPRLPFCLSSSFYFTWIDEILTCFQNPTIHWKTHLSNTRSCSPDSYTACLYTANLLRRICKPALTVSIFNQGHNLYWTITERFHVA